ncbi:MAG: isoleucine--tRNA ligase [Candidatus Thermoplasmatota archaeon]|nr:isoleucine--tRNA ligase [Candidatus Thermoplasmatota archaeon]
MKQAEESYAATLLEERIRSLWDEGKLYERTKEHRMGGERFAFVDGPPYTTGSVHVGTARNKIIKDTVLRWLRMRGYNVRDQPGYDMHGLPIEVLVERSLGITNKREIEEELGVSNFVETCREYSLECLEKMTEEFKDLGVWMDWDRPYMTITNDYIESAWWTLSRANEKGLLARSKRSLEWCPRCETPVAGYEIEFWDKTDPSIYVRFPLMDGSGSLLIWTTTPWTLPANLAVAVNPSYTYAWVRYKAVGGEESVWVVEQSVDSVMKAAGIKEYEVLKRADGSDLVGLHYRHPLLDEVAIQGTFKGDWVHRVLSSDTVTTEFTGLVHTAPGHGPEDFEIGLKHQLEPLSPLDDRGHFTAEGGRYEGMSTDEANEAILGDLRTSGLLFHEEEILHRYGHCWRCHTPILYRATDQWFLQVTQIKERMISEVARVRWTPDWAGAARQYDWVVNARDWTISRQRYWGIPMPVWECPEGHIRVVASAEELKGGEGYKEGMDLHRPWIDRVRLGCEECGEVMTRVPDILDVWFDSAVASWASLGYPKNQEEFRQWWPCPWITEAHDQTRGWFYSQLGAGVVAFDRCPYDSVLMHGWVWPPDGEAFSKSRGDALTPQDVVAKYGRDALRLYELKAAPPWDDFAFRWEEVRNAHRTLNILWNVHRFSTLYMSLDAFDPSKHPVVELMGSMKPEDRWMLSRLQTVISEVAQGLSSYQLHKAARSLANLVVRDISRWYVRLVRDRTWVEGENLSKLCAYRVLYDSLITVAKLLAPMSPFIAEAIYGDLGGPLPTVHMEDWPSPSVELRDEPLEEMMSKARLFVEEVGRLRQTRSYKLRWPVARVVLIPRDTDTKISLEELKDILIDQANAKVVDILEPEEAWPELRSVLKPIDAVIGKKYKSWLPAIVDTLSRAEPEEVRLAVERGAYEVQVQGKPVQITAKMVRFEEELPEGFGGGSTPEGEVYVDFRRTPVIVAECFTRELVRRVQQMRKEMELSVEDYVGTEVQCSERLRGFFEEWRDYVCTETRTRTLSLKAREPKGVLVKEWDLEGERVVIGLARES